MSQNTDIASPSLGQSPPRRDVSVEPRKRSLAVSFAFLLIAVTLVSISVNRAPQLSPFDEATHADYAYQISQGRVPAKGSTIAPEILKQWSCHGRNGGSPLPPCGASAVASQYPELGQNYNFAHPPLYYAITGVIAGVADAALSGNSHFITLARLVGALWLFGAMYVLYVALRRFGTSWQLSAAAAILLPLSPQVWLASTTVNNDGAAALCGSAALLMLARVMVQRKQGWVIPTLVTGLCAATKTLNALPMLAVAGVLLIAAIVAWREGHRKEAQRLVLIVLGVLAATAIVYGGWSAIQSGRGLAGWKSPVQGFSDRAVTGGPVAEIFSTSFTGFQMISDFFLPVQVSSTWLTVWVRLLSFLAASAPLLLLAVTSKREVERRLAGVALLGMISYPMIVELEVYRGHGTYFPYVISRYGMSMIPLMLACLALFAQRRGLGGWMLTGVSTGLVVTLAAASGLINTGPVP